MGHHCNFGFHSIYSSTVKTEEMAANVSMFRAFFSSWKVQTFDVIYKYDVS